MLFFIPVSLGFIVFVVVAMVIFSMRPAELIQMVGGLTFLGGVLMKINHDLAMAIPLYSSDVMVLGGAVFAAATLYIRRNKPSAG